MKLSTRLTHNFVEIRVDETETTIFNSDQTELNEVILNLKNVISDLESYLIEPKKSKEEKIGEIKEIITKYGVINYSDLPKGQPILINCIGGGVIQQAETFTFDDVFTVTYNDEIEINAICLSYDELSLKNIDEIHSEMIEYNEIAELDENKTMERCK